MGDAAWSPDDSSFRSAFELVTASVGVSFHGFGEYNAA
jgi:hypothetical protein